MLHYTTVISCFQLVHSKKDTFNKITYIIVGFYSCKCTKVIRFASMRCILVVQNAIRVCGGRSGSLLTSLPGQGVHVLGDDLQHHLVGTTADRH